jgi:hypothetical protein
MAYQLLLNLNNLDENGIKFDFSGNRAARHLSEKPSRSLASTLSSMKPIPRWLMPEMRFLLLYRGVLLASIPPQRSDNLIAPLLLGFWCIAGNSMTR